MHPSFPQDVADPASVSPALIFLGAFLCALVVSHLVRLWLAARQIRHVAAHRDVVPAEFATRIDLAAHRKAADYTIARVRLGMVDATWSVVVLLLLTVLGGLQVVQEWIFSVVGEGLLASLIVVVAVVVIGAVADLPLDWYRQFRLEERFGFNRMTPALWVTDLLKGALAGAVLVVPLVLAVLWLMDQAGSLWWMWAWGLFVAFNFLIMVLYPTVIAPLFNKFSPLDDTDLRHRIDALLARCGFRASGVFVVDGSKRSSHGNAYFTGFGAAKRIVFFDTLLARLAPSEIEAVLAHELGHFKRHHLWKRMAVSFGIAFLFFAILGMVSRQAWFYQGLGVTPSLEHSNDALALVLFMLVVPVFTFLLQPLAAWSSRRHEFEADDFAVAQTDGANLVSALVKLYEDNASTLTPDPVYSAFYDSHPPAAIRVAHLQRVRTA